MTQALAGTAPCAIAAQQSAQHGNALVHVQIAHRHGVVVTELKRVGGEQQPMTQFRFGTLHAFLHRLAEGKHLS